jgi:hypothetical protein
MALVGAEIAPIIKRTAVTLNVIRLLRRSVKQRPGWAELEVWSLGRTYIQTYVSKRYSKNPPDKSTETAGIEYAHRSGDYRQFEPNGNRLSIRDIAHRILGIKTPFSELRSPGGLGQPG